MENTIKKQNIEYYNHRDYLEKNMQKSNWIQLLEVNHQSVPPNNRDEVNFVSVQFISLFSNIIFI